MATKYPVTERTDVLPAEYSNPKKHIGADWGAEESAANDPNSPSMSTFKSKSSIDPYADYCDKPKNQDPYHNKITKDDE